MEMLQFANPLNICEMDEKGFIRLELGDPLKRSTQGILSYLKRFNPIPEIDNNKPTHQYHRIDQSHFSTVTNEYIDKKINISIYTSIEHENTKKVY
jgi:hypothetical protein